MFHACAGKDWRTRDSSCEHGIFLVNTNNSNNTNVPRLRGKGLEEHGIFLLNTNISN